METHMKVGTPGKRTFRLRREDWAKIGDRSGWSAAVRAGAVDGMTRQDWERVGRRNGWTHDEAPAGLPLPAFATSASVQPAPAVEPWAAAQANATQAALSATGPAALPSVTASLSAPEASSPLAPTTAISPASRYNFVVKRDASGRICSIEATALG
jgi:hypothetical protein